jgi:hypothetical protein
MSTMADYFCPDETPIERDPTPDEIIPDEKALLEEVRQMQVAILSRFPLGQDLDEAMRCCRHLKAYLKERIAARIGCADCGMHWEACCCPVVDPFAQ